MALSILTQFTPIPERSEGTPGLWNARFQQLQDNIASVNSAGDFGIINVKMAPYNARGDGATDDTDSVLRAMNAAANGAALYFPAGSYNIKGTITFSGHSIRVFGAGPASLLTGQMTTVSDPVLFATGKRGVVIEDVAIGGHHSWGAFITGGSGHRVRRTSMSGGIYGDSGGASGGLYLEDMSDVIVEDNHFFSNGTSNITQEGTSDILGNRGTFRLIDARILNNRCSSTSVITNIGIFDPLRCQVRGNDVSGAFTPTALVRGGYGIMLYKTASMDTDSVGQCIVAQNTIRDCDGMGIYTQAVKDTVVDGNVISDVADVMSDAVLAAAAISLEGFGNICTNNRISNSSHHGISVALAHRSVVANNILENIKDIGISIRNETDDVLVIGNSVRSVGVTAIGGFSAATSKRVQIIGNSLGTLSVVGSTFGVWVQQHAQDWTVMGNNIAHANTDRGIFDQGTRSLLAWNRVESSLGYRTPFVHASDGSILGPSLAFSSESSLGWYRAGAGTMALTSARSLDLNQSRLLSVRTLAASAITVSAGNTNLRVNEIAFTVGGASGASLAIHSGGTVYLFNSALSASAT